MYKTIAKTVLLVLCVCLTACTVCCALQYTPAQKVTAERTIETVDEEIKACEALISRLSSEIEIMREEMASVDGENASTEEQVRFLAAQVAVLETQIELNESLLLSCDMKRATAQTEILLVQNEYDYYSELLAVLMRFIYENGTTNEFELLFSSASLTDYLSRRDNFISIMECVYDLRASMEQSLLRLTELEEECAAVSAQYTSHLETLSSNKTALADALEELRTLSEELGVKGDELSSAYAELSKNITEAKERLAALKAEREELYNLILENEKQPEPDPEQPPQQNPEPEPEPNPNSPVFSWPLGDNVPFRVGKRFELSGGDIVHEGLDLECEKGSPVLSVAAGVVTKATWYGGYGNCVIVYHGQDENGKAITTLYGQLSALRCVEGQPVRQGTIIALVGATGRAETDHLHFSVLIAGEYVDPDSFLPDGYYTK